MRPRRSREGFGHVSQRGAGARFPCGDRDAETRAVGEPDPWGGCSAVRTGECRPVDTILSDSRGSWSSVDFPAERAVAVARGRVVQVPATDRGIALRGAPGGGPSHAGFHQLEPLEEPGELRLVTNVERRAGAGVLLLDAAAFLVSVRGSVVEGDV